jgi:hypothetical protein
MSQPARTPRQVAFADALEPVRRAIARLDEPGVVRRLAAGMPTRQEIREVYDRLRASRGRSGGPDFLDYDLNAVAFPVRWAFKMAAERAGAAYQIDATPALWAFEMAEGDWDDAETTVLAAIVGLSGTLPGPPPDGYIRAWRVVHDIASERPALSRAP